MRKTIEQLKTMRETEDHVEFKKGEQGNVSYTKAEGLLFIFERQN